MTPLAEAALSITRQAQNLQTKVEVTAAKAKGWAFVAVVGRDAARALTGGAVLLLLYAAWRGLSPSLGDVPAAAAVGGALLAVLAAVGAYLLRPAAGRKAKRPGETR